MKAQWLTWMAKIDALQSRERVILLFGMLALVWAVFDTLMLTPMLNKQKSFRTEISAKQNEAAQLQAQVVQIVQTARVDPDAGRKQQLVRLQQQLVEKDQQLQSLQQQLITPEQMSRVLESLLQRDGQVKLVSLKTLPVSSLTDSEMTAKVAADNKKAASPPTLGIYKHGFEIKLEGGYLDLMKYMAALENSPWHMLWGGLSLDVSSYPKSSLTLTLYTLSLDKTMLSI